MPRRKPGIHSFHVELPSDQWEDLKLYCSNGLNSIPVTRVVNTLISIYVNECIRPQLTKNLSFSPSQFDKDVQYTLKKADPHA
jgi:hypothetical protein